MDAHARGYIKEELLRQINRNTPNPLCSIATKIITLFGHPFLIKVSAVSDFYALVSTTMFTAYPNQTDKIKF